MSILFAQYLEREQVILNSLILYRVAFVFLNIAQKYLSDCPLPNNSLAKLLGVSNDDLLSMELILLELIAYMPFVAEDRYGEYCRNI